MEKIVSGIVLLLFIAILSCKPIPNLPVNSNPTPQNNSASAVTLVIPRKAASTSAPTVTIEWLSPTSADLNVKNVGGKVEIKVRINSLTPINLEQIDILVNGQAVGNKAGEVGLMKRPEYKDQILTAQVPVGEGSSAVQVVVSTAADKRFFAEQTFEKSAGIVKVSSNQISNSGIRVIWTQPDAFALKENEMFNTKLQEMEVRFNITSPGPVTKDDIQILLNKVYKTPSYTAELRGSNGNYSFRDIVTLNPDLPFNEVALKVRSGASNAISQRLKVNFSPVRPNLYILAIGPKTNLKYSEKDARDFARVFLSQGKDAYRLFNTVTVDTLLGKAATTQAIRLAIAGISTKLRTGAIMEDDILLLFFSSHGSIIDGELYIQADDYTTAAPSVTSVAYKKDILAQIEPLACKKVLFIDACHGGNAKANAADVNSALQDLKKAPRGLAVFASSSEQEESYEDITWANGAFTEILLRGLTDGKADLVGYGNNNGIVSLSELDNYISREVPPLVLKTKNKPQHPKLTRNELGDIPLFIVPKK